MKCYQRILNITYNDHVTSEVVRRTIQAAIENYDELLTLVWLHIKVIWLSKDNGTGPCERKKEEREHRRRGGKAILRSGQGWSLLAELGQLKTGLGGKGFL